MFAYDSVSHCAASTNGREDPGYALRSTACVQWYAQVICHLRDDCDPTEAVVTDAAINRLVVKYFESEMRALPWEAITLNLLRQMTQEQNPIRPNSEDTIADFALRAIAQLRRSTGYSHLWMS